MAVVIKDEKHVECCGLVRALFCETCLAVFKLRITALARIPERDQVVSELESLGPTNR